MKRILTAALLLMASYAAALAANTKQEVTQVTQDVSLTADVDYHITSDEPFTTTGSIDIVNTEHAVVIFDALKPSRAKSYLSFIKINGKAAKDGTNCQLKLYNRGAILLPYGGSTFRPLTVFDGEAFTGESYNTLTEGHNGSGYMKDMPNAWNNRIKSFKLKRGYMVTFALKKGGYGYSRCFIAADSDLEVDLTKESKGLMSGRISSYRLFKWYDTNKVGYAGTDANVNNLLNTTWFYGWNADAINPGSDREYVSQHHHEGWPSIDDVGKNGTSAHALGNNEPDNKADDKEQDLDPINVLANWEKMMATGKRLGSPAMSGNKTWLKQFMDSIDARGWRVDFIAVHDYNLNDRGSKLWNTSDYSSIGKGRPVWLTEMNYGANWTSWPGSNTNGNAANYKIELDHFGPTIDGYNEADYVERYAFYNWVQDCRKAHNTDDASLASKNYLTPMGEYYANTNSGLAYNSKKEYIPIAPKVGRITDLTGTFTASTNTIKLTWSNVNGDFTQGAALQRKEGDGTWQIIYTYKGSEKEDKETITYQEKITPDKRYAYRIVDTLYTRTSKYSNTFTFYTSQATGTANVRHGTISSIPGQKAYAYFKEPFFEEVPVIVCGSATYKNAITTTIPYGVVNNPLLLATGNKYFTYQEKPWNYFANNVYTATAPTKEEATNFIAVVPGNGQIDDLHYEAGNITGVKNTVVEVTFTQPFEEAPVVMVTPIHSNASLPVMTWRIYDVTKEGFKLQLLHQKGETKSYTARKVGYLAIEKGTGRDEQGSLYTVGSAEATFNTKEVTIPYGDDISLTDPKAMVQLQTYNHQAAAILRIPSLSATGVSVRMQVDPTDPDMVLTDSRSATEKVGYIIISTDPEYNGINTVQDSGLKVQDSRIFDLSGRRLQNSQLRQGVYIINGRKVMVK